MHCHHKASLGHNELTIWVLVLCIWDSNWATTVPTDGLPPLGARSSAGTGLAMNVTHISYTCCFAAGMVAGHLWRCLSGRTASWVHHRSTTRWKGSWWTRERCPYQSMCLCREMSQWLSTMQGPHLVAKFRERWVTGLTLVVLLELATRAANIQYYRHWISSWHYFKLCLLLYFIVIFCNGVVFALDISGFYPIV